MADDLLVVEGGLLRIEHLTEGATAPTITEVRCWIYNEFQAVIAANAPGGFLNAYSTTQSLYWYDYLPADLEPCDQGDRYYRLGRLVGTEWRYEIGSFLVWPRTSKLDRYIARTQGWVQETGMGEAVADLSLRDYRDCLRAAVRSYSDDNPREVRVDVTLAADTWEYPLTALSVPAAVGVPAAAWVPDFSQVLLCEPRVDATLQSQYFTGPAAPLWLRPQCAHGILIDEPGGKLRFTYRTPSAGEVARIWYTSTHELCHTADSLPAQAFERVTQYAAGLAMMGPMANRAARTNDPSIASDMYSMRDITERASSQGKMMCDQAGAAWKRPSVLAW